MIHTTEMTIYTAECDKCKKDFEYGDINLFPDRGALTDYMSAHGWELTEDGCLCDKCGDVTIVGK